VSYAAKKKIKICVQKYNGKEILVSLKAHHRIFF